MGKKSDARIARKLEKQFADKQKSARLVNALAEQVSDREVRTGADPGSVYQMKMEWNIDSADREESWSWGVARDWGDEAWNDTLKPKLLSFQEMLWREIEAATTNTGHHMHHSMSRDSICAEAQARLDYLQNDEEDIYRFRLGNLKRLWGFRTVNVFEVLWYDPQHRIYPTDPD